MLTTLRSSAAERAGAASGEAHSSQNLQLPSFSKPQEGQAAIRREPLQLTAQVPAAPPVVDGQGHDDRSKSERLLEHASAYRLADETSQLPQLAGDCVPHRDSTRAVPPSLEAPTGQNLSSRPDRHTGQREHR